MIATALITADNLVNWLAAVVAGLFLWGLRMHMIVQRLRSMPEKVERLERMTVLILMKVDPAAARNELLREKPSEILTEGVN
jgi:hypothetical protein